MSLKKTLNNLIQERGYISYQELKDFCDQNGKKMSVAERRLRPSESPDIEMVKVDGSIYGYKWRGAPSKTITYFAEGKELFKQEVY